MSEFMLERFREICPMKKINGMSREDLSHDVHIAFEIVGYQPNSLSDAWRMHGNHQKPMIYLTSYMMYGEWMDEYRGASCMAGLCVGALSCY